MINVLKENKKFFVTLFYVGIFFVFAITPINFDTKIYLEAAQRADFIGNFPINIINAWEHKFLLNRLLFFVIYKIATLITPVSNIILFESVVKIIYGVIACVIVFLFSKNTKKFFEKYKISETTVFSILYCVIMTSGVYFSLQTEMTALLITLLAIIFVLKNNLIYKLISAFIISTLFWLKGVTILYSVIILMVMILDKQKKSQILITIFFSFVFLTLELIDLYCLFPIEIINMDLATQYLTENNLKQTDYLNFWVINIFYYKFFFIGLVLFIANIVQHIKFKNIYLLFSEFFVWLVMILGVCIQKMMYLYQIGLIIPSIIFSAFIFIYYLKENSIKLYITKTLAMLLIFVLIVSFLLDICFSIQIHEQTSRIIDKLMLLEKQIPDLKSNEILYIGNGLSSYYIKGKSYLNYTTTIFLANDNEYYLSNKYVKSIKEEIKKYNGKYIIIDEIEFLNKFRVSDDIISFIENNYHYKQSTEMDIYEFQSNNYSAIYEKNE